MDNMAIDIETGEENVGEEESSLVEGMNEFDNLVMK